MDILLDILLVIVFVLWTVVQIAAYREYAKLRAENRKLITANKWMNSRLDEIDV